MGIRRRQVASATAIAAAATAVVAASAPARAQPKTESTWDLIKRTGKVRNHVVDRHDKIELEHGRRRCSDIARSCREQHERE